LRAPMTALCVVVIVRVIILCKARRFGYWVVSLG
jgi:hypothetical protein